MERWYPPLLKMQTQSPMRMCVICCSRRPHRHSFNSLIDCCRLRSSTRRRTLSSRVPMAATTAITMAATTGPSQQRLQARLALVPPQLLLSLTGLMFCNACKSRFGCFKWISVCSSPHQTKSDVRFYRNQKTLFLRKPLSYCFYLMVLIYGYKAVLMHRPSII